MADRADRQPHFTVDTNLFRELGALLVGRDSTALVELIKNAYDADATQVVVLGERLDEPDEGRIVITDNGTGMTAEQLRNGFLRIASRLKESEDRRSVRLRRRYTGAKGIGRLAAHKLARLLEVESIAWSEQPTSERQVVRARIDWDQVEKFETLDEITGDDAVKVETSKAPKSAKSGTVLTLSRLRRRWTAAERARFHAEVQSFEPPPFLVRPIRRDVLRAPLLFREPLVRKADGEEQFKVSLEGELAAGDEYWRLMEQHAAWVIEIRCRPDDHLFPVHYEIAPTARTLKELPDAKPFQTSRTHPAPDCGPFFDARIFVRSGVLQANKEQRTWASGASGVRVFMEGFRVLPYGEPRNDWLHLDYDVTRRPRTLETFKKWEIEEFEPAEDKDALLSVLPNNHYYGGVFLVHEHAESLQTLVNREGFVHEMGYDNLVLLVRTGIDLCTRAHSAATRRRREERKRKRRESRGAAADKGEKSPDDKPPVMSLREALADAAEAMNAARAHVTGAAGAGSEALTARLDRALAEVEKQSLEADELISEQSLLRVLASVGTQLAAFIHEINALLSASQAVERALSSLLAEKGRGRPQKQQLRKIAQAVGELRRGLERQGSYLTDIMTPDARRRRSRQRLAERFDVAARLVALHAERRGIRIENESSPDLKSPAMFPAELMAVFTNLLTNAVKAAGEDGEVHASAVKDEERRVRVRLQNSGQAVDLSDAERWFSPFESTTSEVDPVLGQGLGLGLPITRRLLEDYGAEVHFVEPDPDFATAVEIVFTR